MFVILYPKPEEFKQTECGETKLFFPLVYILKFDH